MGERDWRAQKREATRRRLTAAAFALFDERGYDVVSVGEIAHAAGVSVPTFYAYFRTKEHVVLPDQDLTWIAGHLAAQPPGLPLTEQIRRGLRSMTAALDDDGRAQLLRRWQFVRSEPAVRLRAADRERQSSEVIVDILGIDLTTADGAADVVVVEVCLRAATAALMRWAATDGRHPLPELLDEAFTALRSI